MGKPKVCDEGQSSRGVGEVGEQFDVAPSLALAVRNARILDAMRRAEHEVSKLGHCPIMCSLGTRVRGTRAGVVAKRINLKTFAGTCGDGRSSDARDVRASACGEKGLPQRWGEFVPWVERPDDSMEASPSAHAVRCGAGCLVAAQGRPSPPTERNR